MCMHLCVHACTCTCVYLLVSTPSVIFWCWHYPIRHILFGNNYVAHFYSTVGCHPTRCGEFESTAGTTPAQYLEQLFALVKENEGKVAAIGECGLGEWVGKWEWVREREREREREVLVYDLLQIMIDYTFAPRNSSWSMLFTDYFNPYDHAFICFRYFEPQLELSERTGLPLFPHCRNAFSDFMG